MLASEAMREVLGLTVAVLLGCAGCARQAPPANKANIEEAIQQYISTRPGLASGTMATEVKQVRFQGDRAEADVLFRSKANPEASMVMRYVLKRTGPKTWAVESGKPAGIAEPRRPMAAGEAMQSPRSKAK